jgi:hypothetical protein
MTFDTELQALDVPEHRPGFFDELRDALAERETSAARPRLLLVAAVAVVLAGVLAFSLTRGSEVASAAQVQAAVARALASTGSISGVFVNNESGDPSAPGVRWRFVTSSTGAFRIDGLTFPAERVYDPGTNVESSSDGSLFVRRIGLAPGPPDSAPADFVIQRGLGSVVAALAAANDPKVTAITYDGRPAWLLTTRTRIVTVDRATGVPVRNDWLHHGRVTLEWRIEGLRVSPKVTPIKPHERVTHPAGNVQTYDAGFRRVSLSEAKRLAGYAPLVPQHLPTGFKLSAVAFAPNSRATGWEDGGNPPSRDVVSLLYRRGFDEIIVTTRRTGSSVASWRDPLQVSRVATSQPEPVVFTGGVLDGPGGELVLEPDALPHIWTAGPKLVVTIAGTVDRAELLKVATSLH